MLDYGGDWIGALDVAGTRLPLILHVDADATSPVTLDSPEQGMVALAAEQTAAQAVRQGVLRVGWPSMGATFHGHLSLDSGAVSGQFMQRGTTFKLDLVRASEADLAPRVRVQEPTLPLPYTEDAVSITVPGTGVTLAGTLSLPEGDGPFPGVVLLSGSGAHDRDETMAGHRPFRVLADRLVRAGIAVLRQDDRGIGESTGTFAGSTSRDFAVDAAAALRCLASRKEIGRVGFIGHSEGGLVAALSIVEGGADADFVVALASPFVPLREVIARQVEDTLRLDGADSAVIANSVRVQNALLDAATVKGDEETVRRAVDKATRDMPESQRQEAKAFGDPWLQTILRLDPAALFCKAGLPTLALFGTLDRQVAAEPNAAAAHMLPNVEVQVFAGANHLFQGARIGAVAEYATIEETMREDVMARVAEWVK